MKTITPEKVRELLWSLETELSTKDEDIIIEWMVQNSITSIGTKVAALHDKQIEELADFVSDQWFGDRDIKDVMMEWIRSQTLPDESQLSKIAENISERVEPESDPQQIDPLSWYNVKPNFNKGFNDVVSCYYKLVYVNKYGDIVHTDTYSNNSIARPKTTPEVGQVWKNQFGEFEVIAVNEKQVVRSDSSGGFMINSIEDFLTNFERVN